VWREGVGVIGGWIGYPRATVYVPKIYRRGVLLEQA